MAGLYLYLCNDKQGVLLLLEKGSHGELPWVRVLASTKPNLANACSAAYIAQALVGHVLEMLNILVQACFKWSSTIRYLFHYYSIIM